MALFHNTNSTNTANTYRGDTGAGKLYTYLYRGDMGADLYMYIYIHISIYIGISIYVSLSLYIYIYMIISWRHGNYCGFISTANIDTYAPII